MENQPKSISAFIIDDEPIACRRLLRLLACDPEIEVSAVCRSAEEALELMPGLSPDLLFLDVQMPGMDGFSLIQSMPANARPYVIFVTAFDRYALRAFDVKAVDYLLKPFDHERLEMATSRAKLQVGQSALTINYQEIVDLIRSYSSQPRYAERLMIRKNRRMFPVRVEDIDWIEAVGKNVCIYMGSEAYLLSESIGSLESRLDPAKFFRNHRSSMINLERVREFRRWTHGEFKIFMTDGTELKLTRSQSRKFKDLLEEGA